MARGAVPPVAIVVLLSLSAALSPSPAAAGPAGEHELAKVLKSGEVRERLDVVKRLAEGNDPEAEELLLAALGDRDWEVVERACFALARKGTEKSVRPLAELSFQAPSRRIRLAAAAALGAFAPEAGARLLQAALGAKDEVTAGRAAEALAEIRHDSAKEKLLASIRSKDPYLKREAAQALGTLKDSTVIRELETLFLDPDVGARAGAVEGIARTGEYSAIPVLLTELQSPKLIDLVERRIVSAIRRILWARRTEPEAASAVNKIIDAYGNEKSGLVSSRLARTLAALARAVPKPAAPPPSEAVASSGQGEAVPDAGTPAPADGSPPGGEPAAPPPRPTTGPSALEGEGPIGDSEAVVKVLGEVGLVHKDAAARRTAVWALGRVGGDKALEFLQGAVIADADELTRFHALRGYRRWKTAREDEAFQLFAKVLRYDKSALVREEAAVALGVRGLKGAYDTLEAALKDSAWQVAVAAAISLGKTRDPKALGGLAPLLTAKDWKLRGAAAAGTGWANREESVPPLMALLSDPEVTVARTAWEFLKRVTDKDLPLKIKEWEAWWAQNQAKFTVIDREKELRDAKKYGYAMNDRDVYENLDVLVLRSRGDKIEDLLTTLEIKHRLTQSASVKRDGVQPLGVFVSNCTGEIQPDDHERVTWFVHAGGALFGSCWAIDKTIGEEFPKSMRKFPGAKGQVLDQVRAEELTTESEFLNGVFPGLVRPIYELYGAFLIEVLDPERLEVLIDSPDCATRWGGCGNLAAWFTSGHGVVIGSSNHFDRQTISKLQSARGVTVKSESDRRAFAIDHFGFTYEKVRELDGRGVFGKQAEAEKEVTDLSAFRFITNFVRRKRIVDL